MLTKRRASSSAALTLRLGVTIEEAEEMMRVGLMYYRTGAYLYSLLVNSDKRLDAIADRLGVKS